jgi:Papain family cysteine protease
MRSHTFSTLMPSRAAISQFGAIAGLAISGDVTLSNDKGYVRVVMVATDGNEYLVLETNPLLAKGKKQALDEYCEETKSLGSVTPSLLKIEVKDASLMLTSVSASPAAASAVAKAASASAAAQSAAALSSSDRDAQHAEKLLAVRFSVKQKGLHWVAGDTPFSRKTYAEKKLLFGGKVPNLAGFDYYIGGIFEITSGATASSASASTTAATTAGASPYVSDFSWRNKHGQNWMTGVRDQAGRNSCWAFAATGATELLTNIYFNRHLDLDLAEQEAVSCMNAGSCAGGYPDAALDYITQNGIFEEACLPYTANNNLCSNACSSPTEQVQIGGRTPYLNDSEDTLKSMVLSSAVNISLVNWWHSLTVAGYRTLKVGDSFFIRDYTGGNSGSPSPRLIPPSSERPCGKSRIAGARRGVTMVSVMC